ncbi:GIN4 [Candida pseudojiufengensis]|uniref:GIN4 n=1 Tax=Candida pseudojiufengensis TaxID=497109 RepID=UPI002224C921|nr:GIN4 [Candida pseudojiufengensis]KAI5964587.1 GIN4 [Candida pseudojiufengensis]
MSHSRSGSLSSSVMSSSLHNHPQKIGPWKLGKTLGRGATGRVLLATHQTTGQKAAVKVVSKSDLQEEVNNNNNSSNNENKENEQNGEGLPYGIEREIIIMKLLNHPNVLRLYDVWETSKALYLVLEYVEGGELFDLLVERGPLEEPEAIKYFRQIILGTAYCHALGICHRDLKPENLLLDAQLNVKLADFGMAALESNGKLLETSCGSPHYAAPEIVSGLKYHGAASDVWSCGVILFALLTGRLPFDDENIRNLLLKVQAGNYEMPIDEISKEAQNLISKMLEVDPTKRISTEKILKHSLLTKYPCSNEDLISEKSLPHPETAHKSLGSTKNIDKQILSNLTILWNERSEQEIIDCLLQNGANPEKTFYALLLRYRHSSNDDQTNIPKRSLSRSSSNATPKKKRASQINVSRPTSFQYKNGISTLNNNRTTYSRVSVASSVNNSPRRSSPKKRYSHIQASPHRSPYKRKQVQEISNFKATPRNIYNEIVDAQSNQSLPPSLPSKDSMYVDKLSILPNVAENPVVDESPNLLQSAKLSPSKRSSIITKPSGNNNNKRMSKRRSIRASMTNGLKRNSITMKLLSTYAKLAGDDEWEYMDKQTKRTSATFAALCDKIFNQEEYNEDDEQLVDPEELEAREYERLMEIERKKHEAELKARKELEKKKKRQKRRSILSNRKLSIIVKDDDPNNNSEQDMDLNKNEIKQPKRQSKNVNTLRALSEGDGGRNAELTIEELEDLKRRSASQPIPKRKQTPILTRRPVSRLDPLWQAHHNEQIDRAQEALENEWKDNKDSTTRKKVNRESMVSVMDDIIEEGNGLKKRMSRDSYYEKDRDYELPEPNVENSNLTDDYMTEIRKSRLLNSQLNINKLVESENKKAELRNERVPTLIGNVKIPNVTRKSRNFTNSNKRLSVLSIYSTKESYKDLNSIIDSHVPDSHGKTVGLRTSFADRLDKAGLPEEDEEGDDNNSVLDFEEHLANKRLSYHDANKRASRASTTRRYSKPISKVPALPTTQDYDDTFVSKSDEIHKKQYKSMVSDESSEIDDVFDKIKLPDGKSTKSSIDTLANGGLNEKPSKSATTEEQRGKQNSKPMTKVRNNNNVAPTPPTHGKSKQPLNDKTNNYSDIQKQQRKGSFFRKLSWGAKKQTENGQSSSPTDSDDEKPKSSFLRWFSSSTNNSHNQSIEFEIKKFNTILPKDEMSTALFALLNSWSNFGLKDLKHDQISSIILGSISKYNSFNLKSCKFRIKIISKNSNQKSEIICTRVKGSKLTTDTLFNEIEKVLQKEGVLDV